MEAGSGVLDGLLSLPEGGGALRGLGDRFQPDMLRGTGNYSVPIVGPKGPNGVAPNLSLRYSTGAGNGPFGLGWSLAGPAEIRRRSDRGLPTYIDADDEFVLSGAETLVPVGGDRYRPRSDTSFLDIRRTGPGWTVRTKDGRRSTLGSAEASRLSSGPRVMAWLIDRQTDAAGNAVEFEWMRDEGQLYLSDVRWSIWSFHFAYEPRPDVLTDGRAGFLVRTALRCASIERRCDGEPQPIVARYNLTYAEAEGSGVSQLVEVRLTGIAADGTEELAPVLRLGYSSHQPAASRYHRIRGEGIVPPPLHDRGTTLVDMDGDGLPDVLQTDLGGHRWWPNRGDGSFGSVRQVALAPAGMQVGTPGVSFADLNGDGTADLFRVDPGGLGLVAANLATGGWARPTAYRSRVPLRLTESTSRLVDLDGDGVVDVLQSSPGGFVMTYNRGAEGWSSPQGVPRIADADAFPDVDLGRPEIHLADMTGDGLDDIVFVTSGRVDYWPHLGRGDWGRRIRMAGAPVLPAGFEQDRVFLADLDGDGTSDLVYVDYDRVMYWLNRSGTSWSKPFVVPFVPPPALASLHLVDLLGTGTRGLMWSSSDRLADPPGYRFLELVTQKPYLMTRIDNGLGGVTEIAYTTTTAMRTAAERERQPWGTYLPFPIHVVRQMLQSDLVTGRETRTGFRYERGHYDGTEREFRGFERVTMTIDGDAHTPSMAQQTVYFQGVVDTPATAAGRPAEERARDRALAGSVIEVRTFEVAADGTFVPQQSATVTWDARLEFEGDGRFVHFPHTVRTEARDHAVGEPDRIDIGEYEYDSFGNPIRKRRTGRFDGQPDAAALVTEQQMRYVANEPDWLVGLPAAIETRDRDGHVLNRSEHHYDGPAFEGLPVGQATIGLLRRTRELVLVDDDLPPGYADQIDPAWAMVRVADGFVRTTVAYDHDERGNVVAQRDGLGANRTIDYDADFLFPVRSLAPDGLLTQATFDPRSAQPIEVRSPGSIVTRYSYSPLGRLQAQFDTTGDGSMELTQAFLADHGDFTAAPPRPSRITSIRPMAAGAEPAELLGVASDAGLEALSGVSVACDHYDGDGNLLQRVGRGPDAPDGSERWVCARRRKYTVAGRAATDLPHVFVNSPAYHGDLPDDAGVKFFYGPGGQATRIEHPDGSRFAVRYLLNRIEKRDATIPDDGDPIVERYDAWGRVVGTSQTVAPGVVATSAYTVDLLGRPTETRDASGRVQIAARFAGPGEAVRIVHADAGERTYWRDAAGRLRRRTDSLGRDIVLDYDVHGRLVKATDRSGPGPAQVVRELTFDGPRLVKAVEGPVTTVFAHDAASRPTTRTISVDGADPQTIERSFGLRGELSALRYPDGTEVAFSYDMSGSLRAASGFVDGVDYDAHGAPLRIDFAGGDVTSTYEYDPLMRRIRRAALTGPGGNVRTLTYTHDRNGNVASFLDELPGEAVARTFGYDGLYRLTRATTHEATLDGAATRDDRYAYTLTGDLTRNDDSMVGPMTYDDPAHAGRLTSFRPAGSAAAATIDYDAAGRMTKLGALEGLRYDVWDRLVGATRPDGTAVEFTYDHEGTRVRRVVRPAAGAATATRYAENLYETGSGGERLHVYLGRLLVATRSVPPPGPGPVVVPRTAFILSDHLGSALAACDASGTVVHNQVYAPFGRALRPPSELDRIAGFVTEADLGLVRFGARYYAPALGRFITPDWFVAENPARASRLPQGYNAYSYVINNPLAFRDPSGLWFGMDDLIVAAVGFVVGFLVGTIYGLATGKSLGESLLRGLEAGVLGAVGAWLAWNTAGLALGLLGVSTGAGIGFGIAVSAAVIGGLNGTISGMTRIYDWSSPTGWFSFLSDSSWGLVGSGMANLLHIVNLFYGSDRNYRPELSERQNRHVYDGGFGFGNFAFTQGNVISNLSGRRTDLVDHETLHIWQNRLFGPIFTVTYVVWMVVGFFVALAASPFTDQSIGDDIMDVAYLDNPWETWAYDTGGTAGGGTLSWA